MSVRVRLILRLLFRSTELCQFLWIPRRKESQISAQSWGQVYNEILSQKKNVNKQIWIWSKLKPLPITKKILSPWSIGHKLDQFRCCSYNISLNSNEYLIVLFLIFATKVDFSELLEYNLHFACRFSTFC